MKTVFTLLAVVLLSASQAQKVPEGCELHVSRDFQPSTEPKTSPVMAVVDIPIDLGEPTLIILTYQGETFVSKADKMYIINEKAQRPIGRYKSGSKFTPRITNGHDSQELYWPVGAVVEGKVSLGGRVVYLGTTSVGASH